MSESYEVGTRAWQPDQTEGWVPSEVEEKLVEGDKVRLVFRLENGEVCFSCLYLVSSQRALLPRHHNHDLTKCDRTSIYQSPFPILDNPNIHLRELLRVPWIPVFIFKANTSCLPDQDHWDDSSRFSCRSMDLQTPSFDESSYAWS